MGAAWEFASFSIRVAGTKNQQSVALAFTSQILVLLAPMWVNAFDYMVMGRMIYFFIPEQKIWSIKGIKIAKIFVWLDILSFVTQVVGKYPFQQIFKHFTDVGNLGGVMISPGASASSIMTGIHVYMGGIGLQQLCILIFVAICTKFLLTLRSLERSNQILDSRPQNWRTLLYVLFASLALITTRIIFRMVEFAGGLDPIKNPVPYHEAYFMALDALPMLIAIVLMNVVHPSRILKGEGSEFPKGPTRKEKKAAKSARREEKRARKEEERMFKQERKTGKMSSSETV
jgi:hypothetical protein